MEQNVFFNQEKGSLFCYGLGLDLRMITQKEKLSGIGYITSELAEQINNTVEDEDSKIKTGSIVQIKADSKTDFYGIGPLTRMYFKVPLNSAIIFNSDTFITPYMFVFNNQEAVCNFYASDKITDKYKDTLSEEIWTYNSIEQTFHLDFFNFAASVAALSYEHQEFDQLYIYNTPIPEAAYTIDEYSLSAGLCLISVGKTF